MKGSSTAPPLCCPGQEKAEKHEGGRLHAEEKLRLSNSEAWEITPETPQPGRHTQNQGGIYGLGSITGSDSEVTKNGQIKSIVRAGNHPRLSYPGMRPEGRILPRERDAGGASGGL